MHQRSTCDVLSLESQQYFGVRSGIFSLEDPVMESTERHTQVLKMALGREVSANLAQIC